MANVLPSLSGLPNVGGGGALVKAPHYSSPVIPKATGQHPDVLTNFLSDIKNAAEGIPFGLINLAKASYDATQGNYKSIEGMGNAIADSYKYLYGPVFNHPLSTAAYGTMLHRMGQHPLQPLLDAISIATAPIGGLGVGIKAGDVAAQLAEHAGLLSAETAARVTRVADYWRGAAHSQEVSAIPGAPAAVRTFASNPVNRLSQKSLIGTQHILSKLIPSKFGDGGSLINLTDSGFQARNLAKLSSERKNAAATMIQREVGAARNLIKNPLLTAEDIAYALAPHIQQVFQDHALPVHPDMLRAGAGSKITKDWQYARRAPKFDTKSIPHFPKDKTPQAFNSWIDDYGKLLVTSKIKQAAKDSNGNYLVVRSGGKDFMNEAKNAYGALHALYTTPTKVWKWAVLATSPRFFVNNVIGNGVMYGMSANPISTGRALFNTISQIHGERVARKSMTDVQKAQRSIGGDTIDRYYGAATQGFGREATRDLHFHKKLHNMKLAKAAAIMEGGLYGVTHYAMDTIPRRSLINMYSRQTPMYREAVRNARNMGIHGSKLHDVGLEVAAKDTATHRWVVNSVNNVMGQYQHFNAIERGIKAFVPFYSWDRHVVRHSWHLAAERPLAAQAITQLGQQGAAESKQLLGMIPSFMVGDIPLSSIGLGEKHTGPLSWILGDQHGDRKKVLMTRGFDPYTTLADTLTTASSLIHGNPKIGESVAGQLNPFAASAIEQVTGQSLLSGRKVPQKGGFSGGLLQNVAKNVTTQTPIVSAITTPFTGRAMPKVNAKTHVATPLLYRGDERQKISAIMGFPIKEFSPETALKLAKTEQGIKSPHAKRAYNPTISKSLFPSPKTKTYRSRVRKPSKPHVPRSRAGTHILKMPSNLPRLNLAHVHKPRAGSILPKAHIKGLPSIRKL